MADVHSKIIRSYNMARIRSKNTNPELIVRKFLFASGFRFRLHDKTLPGKPDIILKNIRTAIFVHGCFWHKHVEVFIFPLRFRIRFSNEGARFAPAKSHLPEQPLALADTQVDSEFLGKVMAKQFPIPQEN